jgi:hypothetical protein
MSLPVRTGQESSLSCAGGKTDKCGYCYIVTTSDKMELTLCRESLKSQRMSNHIMVCHFTHSQISHKIKHQ